MANANQAKANDPSIFISAPDGGGMAKAQRRAGTVLATMNVELIDGGTAMIINVSDFDEAIYKRPGSREKRKSRGAKAERKTIVGGANVADSNSESVPDKDVGERRSRL